MKICKHAFVLLSLSTLFFLQVRGAHSQQYVWHACTPAQAIQTVRTFENNPNLDVKINRFVSEKPGFDLRAHYELTAGAYNYWVGYYTPFFGKADRATYDSDYPEAPQEDPNIQAARAMLPVDVQRIARAAIVSHFPFAPLLGNPLVSKQSAITLNSGQKLYKRCEFSYREDCGGSVQGPSFCIVTVDTVTGRILRYDSIYFPVFVSATPRLTSDQAIASAMNSLHVTNGTPGQVYGLHISAPDIMGVETLFYDLEFFGSDADASGNITDYIVGVDANTGEVLYSKTGGLGAISPPKLSEAKKFAFAAILAQSAKSQNPDVKSIDFVLKSQKIPLNQSPLLIDKHPYFSCSYLGYELSDCKVAITNQAIHVDGSGRQVNVPLGAKEYTVNGQKKVASAKPIKVHERYYVPLDVMQAVLSGKMTYNSKAQEVRYDPPAKTVSHLATEHK